MVFFFFSSSDENTILYTMFFFFHKMRTQYYILFIYLFIYFSDENTILYTILLLLGGPLTSGGLRRPPKSPIGSAGPDATHLRLGLCSGDKLDYQ